MWECRWPRWVSLAHGRPCEQIRGSSPFTIESRLADIPAQFAEALRDRYVFERELGRRGCLGAVCEN